MTMHTIHWAAWWFIMLLFILFPAGNVLPASAATEARADASAVAFPRVIPLNGSWERQFLERLHPDAIRPDKWEAVQIPSMNQNGKGHFAAYRTNISVANLYTGIRSSDLFYLLHLRLCRNYLFVIPSSIRRIIFQRSATKSLPRT